MASPPFKVKALYEYSSPHEDDLDFPVSQIITVTEEEDADWYVGEYTDASGETKAGLFPKNFVEKYEPERPPRPSRQPRPKQSAAAPAAAPHPEAPEEPEPEPEPAVVPTSPTETPSVPRDRELPTSPPVSAATRAHESHVEPPLARKPSPAPVEPAASVKPAPPPATKAPPPAVAEKPSSFKDRIAAFNKPQQPPLAPLKPGGGPSGPSFVKKPFVAPPPSRDAYVPSVRDPPPQKTYRREEDPEIADRLAQDQENAERAGLTSPGLATEESEEAPKPTSLKERIALLQKQEKEQAARRAEAAHKEKPKKPPKKRTESHERRDTQESEEPYLERVGSEDHGTRSSADMPREARQLTRRSSHIPPTEVEPIREREPFSDANDADQSAAGETTEDAGASTGMDDEEEVERPQPPSHVPRAPGAPSQEPEVGDEEDTTEGEGEEEEMDEETRRRLELRERMAKMSGGMGMAGMFGGPPGIAAAGSSAKKKKSIASGDGQTTEFAHSPPPTARVPMIPVPGMSQVKSPDSEGTVSIGDPDDVITTEEPEIIEGIDDEQHQARERTAPPPLPKGNRSPFRRRQHLRQRQLGASWTRGVPALPVVSVSTGNDMRAAFRGPMMLYRPVPQPPTAATSRPPPPVPGDRPVPPPPDSRPVPLRPAPVQSPSAGSESDDEMPQHPVGTPGSIAQPGGGLPSRGPPPPIPSAGLSHPADDNRTPHTSQAKRLSYFGADADVTSSSPVGVSVERRTSRPPPPIPGSGPMTPGGQSRPPPPPPPTAATPSRQPTTDIGSNRLVGRDGDGGETEYEGDYDTDIATGASHRDALKARLRDPSLDESTTTDDTPVHSPPAVPTSQAPPLSTGPRAVPPPPPPGVPPRRSVEVPRAAPPPVPPPRELGLEVDDDEYDPFRYMAPATRAAPSPRVPPTPNAPPPVPAHAPEESSEDELYAAPPPRRSVERNRLPPLPQERPAPPVPAAAHGSPSVPPPAPPPGKAPIRRSLEVERNPTTSRKSTDIPRPSGEQMFIANDVHLGESSQWWTAPKTPPPVFQGRKDILVEVEESSTSKRGGKTTIAKDVYVLFQDYSQTVVTARFDARDASDVSLEQRHEPPPPRPRQDQLEDAQARFGQRIAQDAASLQNTTVGDGTPQALVQELLQPHQSALLPIGTRSYGALVYSNLANATVQQHDEIRPGDILTIRNAKFQGKHGAMHAKYSMDVGKPDHVAVVVDWDGTKKKVRAWEQGRESKKVKVEGFRVGDLRSGEVRVWRVMERGWVGWDSE